MVEMRSLEKIIIYSPSYYLILTKSIPRITYIYIISIYYK